MHFAHQVEVLLTHDIEDVDEQADVAQFTSVYKFTIVISEQIQAYFLNKHTVQPERERNEVIRDAELPP